MQHCVWMATAPISFPYLAAFKCPLDGLDHGTSVGQLGTELLLGIFCVAELVQLGVIVKAKASAGRTSTTQAKAPARKAAVRSR